VYAFHIAAGNNGGLKNFASLFHLPTSTFSLSVSPHSGYSGGSGGGTVISSAPTSSASSVNPADIPAGFTAAQLSPYFHDVRFLGVSAGSAYSYGTITLALNAYDSSTTIDITGWQIKSRNGGEYIPQAIDVYDPSGLTPPSDIVMKNGDYVYLYSSSAPFNLRLNECIGYIAQVANFEPALPRDCPYVDYSQLQNFSGACQNYIESIGNCEAPNLNSPSVPRNDYSCVDYLNTHFTYRSCFQDHSADPNFLSNQVWVWMGSNVIDQYHDRVLLLDKNGLLVDEYTY